MTTNLKRNAAILGSAVVIAALGLGGVMSANAGTDPSPTHSTQLEQPDGDGDVADDGEQSDGDHEQSDGDSETADNDTNVGPDADPSEPGHKTPRTAQQSDTTSMSWPRSCPAPCGRA
ncbi:MAG: hypothetical protein WKF82_10650 [Nocardioidaceae bacterium]